MKYFDSLPYLTLTDSNNNSYLLKNLLIRTRLLTKLARNPMLFYKYTIQDGDTPENIAYKYYGDQYRYWIVLLANEIVDPQWQWPLTNQQLTIYLNGKYSADAGGESNVFSYIQTTIHHYEKLVTTVDNSTQTTSIKSVEIDEDTYNTLQIQNKTNTFADGSTVTYGVNKQAVTIYEYEVNLNESKREINLLNASYAADMENQYQKLVTQ